MESFDRFGWIERSPRANWTPQKSQGNWGAIRAQGRLYADRNPTVLIVKALREQKAEFTISVRYGFSFGRAYWSHAHGSFSQMTEHRWQN